MKIPFNVLEFLYRAERGYGDRVGIIDEAEQPGRQLGRAQLA